MLKEGAILIAANGQVVPAVRQYQRKGLRSPHRVGNTGGHAAALSLNQDSTCTCSVWRVAVPKRFVF